MSSAPSPALKPQQSDPSKSPSGKSASGPAPAKPTGPSRPVATTGDGHAKLRRSVYGFLIAISVGAMVGRVFEINSVDQIGAEKVLQQQGQADVKLQRPFLSGNDRSRWLTVRALVEKGTFAIDQFVTDPKTYPNWDTIDAVMHVDSTDQPHIYSSKPPLLAVLYTGPYWLTTKIATSVHGSPVNLGTNPYEIGRGMLLLVNVLPMIVYFFVLAGIVDRYGRTDWGRIFIMAAATLGTFLPTFAVAINNHLPAAVCAAITLSTALRIWYEEDRRSSTFIVCGFFAALTAAFELPAASLFAAVTVAVLWKAPRKALITYLPPALLVVIAFFAMTWLAHGSLVPPYGHRFHKETAQPAADATAQAETPATPTANPAEFQGTITLDSGQTVTLRGNRENWYDFEFTRTDGRTIESYWRNPKGIDAGEPSIGKYSLHLLIGHHGIFSLSPIWLLAIPGMLFWLWSKIDRRPALALLIGSISVVVILFYILRPLVERNYGGTVSAFRWVFWLAPLWLVAALPMADWLSKRRIGRLVGYVLMALSALSASYPVWNPWSHPWLWNFWTYMGW